MNAMLGGAAVLASAALVLRLGLPALLRALGLHRRYTGVRYRLPGGRALIVTTSHATLDPPGEPGTGKPTGVFASEMTAPYYAFVDAGMEVDVASVRGGRIPIEPMSLAWALASEDDRRFQRDGRFQAQVRDSLAVSDVDFTRYDIVFLAGGWGAAYDLAPCDELARGLSVAWATGKVVGGVCHGPLGLLHARDANGLPLVHGKRLTAVTDRQVQQLGIRFTPLHPERELRAAGARFEASRALLDMFATHVVTEGRLVTGQNQNSGAAAAQAMVVAAGGLPQLATPNP